MIDGSSTLRQGRADRAFCAPGHCTRSRFTSRMHPNSKIRRWKTLGGQAGSIARNAGSRSAGTHSHAISLVTCACRLQLPHTIAAGTTNSTSLSGGPGRRGLGRDERSASFSRSNRVAIPTSHYPTTRNNMGSERWRKALRSPAAVAGVAGGERYIDCSTSAKTEIAPASGKFRL
jgi:hypothetical protein